MFPLIGIFVVVVVLALAISAWPRRRDVPRNLPGWTRTPLIAFAVFVVGPSVLGLILYGLYLAGAHSLPLIGALERPPRLGLILGAPLALAVGLWPFLTLYGVTLDKLIQGLSTWRSVRMATIVSVAAMSLPSAFLLVGALQDMMSSAPDAGQGTGIACVISMLFLPIPAVLGWLAGRGIARLRD